MSTLNEVIWEITNKCNKNCSYCGSSDIINRDEHTHINTTIQVSIMRSLAAYDQLETVIFSGGEPAMNIDALKLATEYLYDKYLKVLTNGLLFEYTHIIDLNVFDSIGVSINTEEDIDVIGKKLPFSQENLVMITNFGTHNIFKFAKLYNCFREHDFKVWQIQLTMGKYQLDSDGIRYLYNNCENMDKSKPFVMADNLKGYHQCTAGINSCGVLWNGDVVACLSERNYGIHKVYGNLVNTPIKEIWENEFKDIRYDRNCSRKCCRCHIDYPPLKVVEKEPYIAKGLPHPSNQVVTMPNNNSDAVIVYGVSNCTPK